VKPGALDAHERIAVTLEMLHAVSRETDPNEATRQFALRYGQLYPLDRYVSTSRRGLGPGEYKITRSMTADDLRSPAARSNPWRDWASLPVHRGGFLGEVMAGGEPRVYHNLRIRDDPAVGNVLSEMGSCVAVPLLDAGEDLNWSFMFRRDPAGYDEDELAEALLVSNLVGSMTKHLVANQEIRRLNQRLTAQFEEVARVQQSLLPTRHPEVPGLVIATSYLPSDLAGGDYYDFFELPGPPAGGRWGFLIADVAGHGVGAATVMAMLHAILHSYPNLGQGPAAVMRWANDRLCAAGMASSFVTAVFATYEPATRTLRYARAGHPPPLVKEGATGRVWPLAGAASLPLGIEPDFDVTEATVRLGERDTVVLYTDGITEALGRDRRTMFGVAGLERALEVCSGEPDCVVDSVHAALHEHTGVLTRSDDQTLVAFRVAGAAG
jgi:sigma-B regulation protein RsbU (phosphoserine phosphatase)